MGKELGAKNKSRFIKPCPIEEMYLEDGWVVIYDGQKERRDGSCQFPSPPEERRVFTRVLQKMENGKLVKKWIEFKYDMRTKYVVNIPVILVTAIKLDKDGKKMRQVLEQKRWGSEIEAGG